MSPLIILAGAVVVVIIIVLVLKNKGSSEKFQRLPNSYPNSADLMTLQLPDGPSQWNADQWLRVGVAVDSSLNRFDSSDPTLLLYQNIADPSIYMLRDNVMLYQFTFRSNEQIQRGGVISVEGNKYKVM